MALGMLGIILSLALLILLAYRGVSVIIAAPLSALLALVLSGIPVLPSYTEIFMPALGGFLANYFPLFLTGAIFGGLMSATGYARDIAQTITRWIGPKRALVATVLTSALLTYGGISVFVVVFVMFPLALELFRAADVPRRLIPASIGLGILTFTMTALPGTPQVQNIIPGTVFGTGIFAAPGIGILATVIIFGAGMAWLEFRSRRLHARGESFADSSVIERRNAVAGVGSGRGDIDTSSGKGGDAPAAAVTHGTSAGQDLAPNNHIVPFVPLLVVFALNFGCSLWIFPGLDWSFLSEEKYGGITLDDRIAVWSVLTATVAAILVILALNVKNLRRLWSTIIDGAKNALLPIFSTGSEVGYGAVIASVGAFSLVRDGILGVSGNALVASAVSTSTIAGITGSASGGMTIALNALGEDLKSMAVEQGISMDAMHRITALASGGLDSMPHNGAIITLLLVCGMTHRESYKDIAVISIIVPVAAVAILIPVIMMFGSF